ncbi:protein phosphatase 2C, putative [Trichomonas vaginalis G3]|uniref:Protein phosphatase 2C, putative n=1 Tax=Trichomonas vaginalis (strain ATCC PRA-98 / G3) TaxID=412133 RepID=A2DHS0_TRIV3|nr:protein serine/threonine phosphatase protein [Trichomonas vaginalis G3]EAY20118.1 protein phosphatase 2C, putative [Trichomonas vaginalis G3]KAI5528071.1 protein serine/threonine phosphatase protein [Trichomonas vaginalis G3]|eukprot:XP_001581104.1 protein phosphatase 2C [Trichomonas vaginalis G3]
MTCGLRQKATEKHFFIEGEQVYPGSHADAIGKRKTMEDAATVVGEIFGPKTQYYGVFDGHGGNGVSMYLAKELHGVLKQNYSPDIPIETVITKSFQTINEKMIADFPNTGSTASIALIIGDKITIANVGDTRILLLDTNNKVTRLSVDHNISNKAEVDLVIQRGGTIMNDRVNGVVSLTRSFGDGLQASSISCEPNIVTIDRHDNEKLIIACDGVFEVLSDDVVGETYMKMNDPSKSARLIKDTAIKRGSGDNITVVCVSLTPK